MNGSESKAARASASASECAIDVRSSVPEWVEDLRDRAESKGLVLRCAVDPDLPELIECDPAGLRQIVVNLVRNAIRATEHGWVLVCVEPAWNDPDVLAISITDTGPGMDEDAIRVALGEVTSVARPPSWGLGLAISAGHAARLGGSLAIGRAGGRGLRAELRIPLRPCLPEYAAAREATLVDERDIVRPLDGRPLGRTGAARTERRKHRRLGISDAWQEPARDRRPA